jgi:hypothetical protein
MKLFKHFKKALPVVAALAVVGIAVAQNDAPKKIKALLVTGEGYHDYEAQKKIITEGISERMPIEWTIQHDKTAEECKANLSKADWAKGYDIVVYNICHAKEADTTFIDSVAAVHGKSGVPAVVLHCSLHSFHWDVKVAEGEHATWVKFLGVRSRNHGPKAAIKVKKLVEHEVTKDLPDGWTTPEGELYNVLEVLPTATALATGDNGNVKEPQVCIWVNQYDKARVFGTSIGHHNSTMQTKEYLDLLTNGIKWAVGK